MHIAAELHKFESEVLDLTPDELARWIAFFNILAKEQGKAMKRAETRAKIRRK